MFSDILENVRKTAPIVHNITNYVTVNDCANILLACGASPIMADDIGEAEEITAICSGLNINMGTLNQRTIPSMLAAGKKSVELGHPVLLDPVGVGASKLRTETALKLLSEIKFSAIRGNVSEIKTLLGKSGSTSGVDANLKDKVTEKNLDYAVRFAKDFSQKTGAVIAVTGEIDIVADKNKAYCIYNGNAMMSKVTGTGCQLSALITAFIASNKNNLTEAVAAAVCAMGICGDKALSRMSEVDGNASFRNYIIDGIFNLKSEELERGAKYELR